MTDEILDKIDAMYKAMVADHDAWKAKADRYESAAWDAFESGYMQGHNDTVESCVRDSKESASDYFSDIEYKARAALQEDTL